MEKSNSINSLKIIKSLEGFINLTVNDCIIWHHNETTSGSNSYVSEKCRDLTDGLFYKLTIFRKELFDSHEYDYNLLITVIDCNGVENNHDVNKYTIKNPNHDGLSEQLNIMLENLYNRVKSNVYDIENQYTADLLVKVLDSFSRYGSIDD